MINRISLKCTTCGAISTTRTAIGRGTYQEFAFPCPGCGVEIRYGMTLDQEKVTFEYSKIENAIYSDSEETGTIFTFDGENLVPLQASMLSPFIATFSLPLDQGTFLEHRAHRIQAIRDFWPVFERLQTHYSRHQWDFFDQELQTLGYSAPAPNLRARTLALLQGTHDYGVLFSPPTHEAHDLVLSRIQQAQQTSETASDEAARYFVDRQRHETINNELSRIRHNWTQIAGFLLPLYNMYYWDDTRHSLDEYTIAQKRFDELKPFYVDCFETLCRISCIAAALEGVISLQAPVVPTRRGSMLLEEFEVLANGSKPDVLRNLLISPLFVPYIDSHLRNGMGHNAARYNVTSDTIEYVNEGRGGRDQYSMPYMRFCEKVVCIYGQLESVAAYADWMFLRST